jgi:hypothetical protein
MTKNLKLLINHNQNINYFNLFLKFLRKIYQWFQIKAYSIDNLN